MVQLEITSKEEGQRLDKFLKKYLNQAPASFIYKMLRKKNIKLNGKKADGTEKIKTGDQVQVYLADDTLGKFRDNKPEALLAKGKLDVLYEDSQVLIVNKPAGMLSQKANREDVSLVEEVLAYLRKNGMTDDDFRAFSPGVCNRLDRNTSGIVVAGKTLHGLQTMSELIREREVQKYYLTMVKGNLKKSSRLVGYLSKDAGKNEVTVYDQDGENRVRIETEYEPIQNQNGFTLLKVHLITGKSHQIRAHLSSIGHCIVGDTKYGDREINQQMKKEFGLNHQLLHAYELHFPEMNGAYGGLSNRVVKAPLPDLFEQIKRKYFE